MAGGWALSSPTALLLSQQASPKFCHLGSLLTVGAYAELPSGTLKNRKNVVYLNGVRHPGLCSDHPDSVLDR